MVYYQPWKADFLLCLIKHDCNKITKNPYRRCWLGWGLCPCSPRADLWCPIRLALVSLLSLSRPLLQPRHRHFIFLSYLLFIYSPLVIIFLCSIFPFFSIIFVFFQFLFFSKPFSFNVLSFFVFYFFSFVLVFSILLIFISNFS